MDDFLVPNLKYSILPVFLLIIFSFLSCNQAKKVEEKIEVAVIDTIPEIPPPKYLYGIQIDSFDVKNDKVKRNQNLSEILNPHNVDYPTIDKLARKSRSIFDVRKIKTGNPYTLICAKDSNSTAKFMVYEKDKIEFIVFDLQDSINIYTSRKTVDTLRKSLTGVIQNSLYVTLMEKGANAELTNVLADLYAWQIDFFRIQKNDKFKVIYDELFVEGESVGIHKVHAAEFEHFGSPFYAFYFHQNQDDYFDEKGESLRKAFLKAPLRYSRISSRYTMRRYHPVQGRNKPHLGTDYAAPHGTPIYAVGDGVISEARYKRYNGNYVKIRHNSVYSTQYLHMQKIKSGIRPGTKVKQGDVIGYVGSTGLATGPHCCFRFWKNGYQVDPFKQKIPPSEPILEENFPEYNKVMKAYKKDLEKLKYEKNEIFEYDTTDVRISLNGYLKPLD